MIGNFKIPFTIVVFTSLLTACSKENKNEIPSSLLQRYNKEIEKGYEENASWVEAPLSIALKLSRAGEASKEAHISMLKLNKGEVARKVRVTIKEEGIIDCEDSDSKSTLYLEKVNEKWQVVQNLEED